MGLGLTIPRPGWMLAGLALVAAVIGANRWEHHHRLQPAGALIQAEDGPSGHTTLGIREDPDADLTFAALASWAYTPGSPAPAHLQAVDGRTVRLTGFMFPLQPGDRVTSFCLLRTTQTCCYGPRPDLTQFLVVEVPEPVTVERLAPVTVQGRFRLDPQPADGYLYRLESARVARAAGAGADPTAWATAHGHHPWRWEDLIAVDPAGPTLPPALTALDRLPTVLSGVVHHRSPGEVLVARPGLTGLPTLNQAATVVLHPGLPDDQSAVGSWYGTLQVVRDPAQWPDLGVVRLVDARPLPPAIRDDRPFLPVDVEVVLVLLVLLLSIQRRPATAVLLLALVGVPVQAEVLATVGSQPITLAQVAQGLPPGLFGPVRRQAQAERLDDLIRRTAAAQVLAQRGVQVDPDALRAALERHRQGPFTAPCGCHTVATWGDYLAITLRTDADVIEDLRLDLAADADNARAWAALLADPVARNDLLATAGQDLRRDLVHLDLRYGDGTPWESSLVSRDEALLAGLADGTPPRLAPGTLSAPLTSPAGTYRLRWRPLTDDEVLERLRQTQSWRHERAREDAIAAVPVIRTPAGTALQQATRDTAAAHAWASWRAAR